MKKVFNLLIYSLICITVYAQPKPVKPISTNDSEAEKQLKALKAKYALLSNYKMTYKMQMTDANNKSTTMSGSYTGSGEKYIIEVDHTKSITDGKTFWSLDTKQKEIQINNVSTKKKNKVETPIDIIKQYNKLFKYRVKEPLTNGVIVLELIPLDKNSPYFKIDLHIQVSKLQLISAKLYDKGGNRVNFAISKTEENIKLSADAFNLKAENYKGFEIMDLR